MKLKKLEILGFKSFADKATLEFHEGVTAIVGPNGCGKSNIADAFRWVLGEQSAKSMRGGKMHDVIFAGTNKRSPLNIAEVTITLTDIAGELPVDYDEVSITRRLHRNGESVYLINKHAVRLKDVQDMLLGSGIGKSAFSIFEQGKIDQIIHYTPIERRCIFEEAAGILRFLQRKREALRKLEHVDNNLSRLRDITQEVEKQISVLEKQAEKAKDYKEKKVLLEKLDKGLLATKWNNLNKRQVEGQRKQEDLRKRLEDAAAQSSGLEAKLREMREDLSQTERTLREKSEDIIKIRGDKEIKTRERQSHNERLKELSHKEKKWFQELESLAERRQQREQEAVGMKKQQTEIESTLTTQEDFLKEQREKVHALENKVSETREKQQACHQELLNLIKQENQIESELKQNAVRQENQLERKDRLLERKEKISSQTKELTQHAIDKKRELDAVSKAVDEQKGQFALIEKKIEDISSEIHQRQQEINSANHDIAEAKARQKVLLRLRDDMEGFSAGSKRLLQEAANPKSPLYQRLKGLYEYIAAKEGYENAIATILRPYAQTLVASTKEDFDLVDDFAKQNKLKDFSLTCLESLPQISAISLKSESILQYATENALSEHFLKNIFLSESIENSIKQLQKHPGSAFWISDGIYLNSKGVIFHASLGQNNVFVREAEIKSVEKKLGSLEKEKIKSEEQLKQLQLQKNELANERTALDKSIRRDEMTLIEANFGMQRINNELEKAANEEKQLAVDLKNIEISLESLAATLEMLKQKMQASKGKATQLQNDQVAFNQGLEKETIVLKNEKSILLEKEAIHRKAIDEHKKLLHSLHILEVKDSESKQQEHRLSEEIQSSGSLQAHILQRGVEVDQALNQVEKTLEEALHNQKGLEEEVANKKKSIHGLDQQIGKEKNLLKPIEEELQRTTIQLAQIETNGNSLIEELQERYQMTMDEAQELNIQLEKSIEQTERQVRSLRQEITQSGDINMTAIDEFDQQKSRHSFLSQQISDLDVSKNELVQIINQLDNESKKLFKETFEKISENFKKNFQILFNGGEADLQFTESNDILDAGIEIIAKPPGKQMRSIQLLSGGEKCMTAVALLFAIFEVKPAPFCILDEIDAPLDESNVERFVNVVKQFIDRCQFLIITHNKRTMAAADVLFGVSMQERGVSKLLSMSFAKEPSLAVVDK